jgi:hypothetical protein
MFSCCVLLFVYVCVYVCVVMRMCVYVCVCVCGDQTTLKLKRMTMTGTVPEMAPTALPLSYSTCLM